MATTRPIRTHLTVDLTPPQKGRCLRSYDILPLLRVSVSNPGPFFHLGIRRRSRFDNDFAEALDEILYLADMSSYIQVCGGRLKRMEIYAKGGYDSRIRDTFYRSTARAYRTLRIVTDGSGPYRRFMTWNLWSNFGATPGRFWVARGRYSTTRSLLSEPS